MKNLIKNTVMMIVALLVSASCNGNNSVRQKKMHKVKRQDRHPLHYP